MREVRLALASEDSLPVLEDRSIVFWMDTDIDVPCFSKSNINENNTNSTHVAYDIIGLNITHHYMAGKVFMFGGQYMPDFSQ